MAEIKQLPADVARRIAASSSITSLNDVILGLLHNALDANSKKISIRLDYGKAMCCVEDDGNGICTADFEDDGGLGKAHHTSNTSNDKHRLGCNGLFLWCVAALSTMSIISKHWKSASTNALILHYSAITSRLIPAPEHMALDVVEHGTKISVHDLFGNMAVRVKQRPTFEENRPLRDRQWSSLCHNITGTLLAQGRPLYLVAKGGDSSHTFRINTSQFSDGVMSAMEKGTLSSKLITSALRQAFGLDTNAKWVQTSARTSKLTARALICLEPSASRLVQFITMGRRHMPHSGALKPLYETLDQLFCSSSFGLDNDSFQEKVSRQSDLVPLQRRLPESRHGLERWPMFVIRIEVHDSKEYDLPEGSGIMATMVEMLTAMIIEFLQEHHFRPNKSRKSVTVQHSESCDMALVKDNPERTAKVKEAAIRDKVASGPGLTAAEEFWQLGLQIHYPCEVSDQRSLQDATAPRFRSRFVGSTNMQRLVLAQTLFHPQTAQCQSGQPSEPADLKVHGHNQHGTPECAVLSIQAERLPQPAERILSLRDRVASEMDEYVDWTDPHTKQRYKLNTRTGWTLAQGHHARPATSDDANARSAITRKQPTHLPRLTRSAHGLAAVKQGSWMQQTLENWKNPVFETTEQPICSHHFDPHECKRVTSLQNSGADAVNADGAPAFGSDLKISVSALEQAEVIRQVDSKFILIKLQKSSLDSACDLVVLVDQHASDERIKVEKLMAELCSPPSSSVEAYTSPLNHKSRIETIVLEDPIFFDLLHQDYDAFMNAAAYFARWGILYDLAIPDNGHSASNKRKNFRLAVLSLPLGIAQRCRAESVTLIKMLRTEAWNLKEGQMSKQSTNSAETRDWTKSIHGCPEGMLNLLNSRACRSAIMFNDALDLPQCKSLISDLAKCRFPFQCAHGRPSMVPLIDLGQAESEYRGHIDAQHSDDFQGNWSRWVESNI